jgi:hypothetical protein
MEQLGFCKTRQSITILKQRVFANIHLLIENLLSTKTECRINRGGMRIVTCLKKEEL